MCQHNKIKANYYFFIGNTHISKVFLKGLDYSNIIYDGYLSKGCAC